MTPLVIMANLAQVLAAADASARRGFYHHLYMSQFKGRAI
jgi:hypothetical protein